jgi:hypothetical protein
VRLIWWIAILARLEWDGFGRSQALLLALRLEEFSELRVTALRFDRARPPRRVLRSESLLWANGGQPASAEARVIRPIVCSSPPATNLTTDQLGADADLIVYGEFEDEAQLAAYKAHPHYQRSIELVRPLRELRIAADYRAEEAVRGSLLG